MTRSAVFAMAVLAASPLWWSGPAPAASSSSADDRLPPPSRLPAWRHAPATVTQAAAALRDACAAWPKESLTFSDARETDAPQEAPLCEVAMRPESARYEDRVFGGMLGAAAAGIGAVTFLGLRACLAGLLALGRTSWIAGARRFSARAR